MSKKQVLSKKPLVYSSAKELWDYYAKEKFLVLKSTKNVNDYYDFIFAMGSVGYWLAREGKAPSDNRYYQIFNSIYNNTKHYELNHSKFSVYVVDNQRSLFPTDGKGNTFLAEGVYLISDALFLSHCEGESDKLLLCCEIFDQNTKTKTYIMLYEICKQVFELYERIFAE